LQEIYPYTNNGRSRLSNAVDEFLNAIDIDNIEKIETPLKELSAGNKSFEKHSLSSNDNKKKMRHKSFKSQ